MNNTRIVAHLSQKVKGGEIFFLVLAGKNRELLASLKKKLCAYWLFFSNLFFSPFFREKDLLFFFFFDIFSKKAQVWTFAQLDFSL
ncbi:MAG: hypothetical protein Q4D38_01165 [Planctomycetia bacterium]|nr:hypothetical protein [Planctomycetia bacterium]